MHDIIFVILSLRGKILSIKVHIYTMEIGKNTDSKRFRTVIEKHIKENRYIYGLSLAEKTYDIKMEIKLS